MGIALPAIVSGCQTGVDRGAASVALDMKATFWGWCPRGRKAEDGLIPAHFAMIETRTANYWERTEANVRDTDATLIIAPRETLDGGTKRTAELADKLGKPRMLITTDDGACCRAVPMLLWWLEKYKIGALNVAGPRASKWPQGHDAAYHLVGELLHSVRQEIDRRVPF